MTNLQSLDFYWPELILTGVIVLAILLDLFLDKKDSGNVGWVLILGLIVRQFGSPGLLKNPPQGSSGRPSRS